MAAPSVVRLRVLCVTSPNLRNLSIKYSKYGISHRPFWVDSKQDGGLGYEEPGIEIFC